MHGLEQTYKAEADQVWADMRAMSVEKLAAMAKNKFLEFKERLLIIACAPWETSGCKVVFQEKGDYEAMAHAAVHKIREREKLDEESSEKISPRTHSVIVTF